MERNLAARLTEPSQWFRYWLPYSFIELDVPDRDHVYLPVNRNHNPLGMTSEERVDPQSYVEQAIVFSVDPHSFQNVWCVRNTLQLYGDEPESRTDYFERLERLFRRSMKLFDQSP